jgi:D-3-phosphoglycerate dehydrogenase
MISALRVRKIAMAGLDVFDQEPLPRNHPLPGLRNVVMTPHIGYVTEQSMQAMYAAMIDVLAAYRRGETTNRYIPPTK